MSLKQKLRGRQAQPLRHRQARPWHLSMRTTGPWQGSNTWIDLKPWPFASDNLTTSTCSRGKRNYEQQQQCGIEHPVVSETWSLWWFAPNWQDEVPAPEMRIDHGVSGGSLSPMWERRGNQTRQPVVSATGVATPSAPREAFCSSTAIRDSCRG